MTRLGRPPHPLPPLGGREIGAVFERISYRLPPEAIAQRPAERRDEARLLVLHRQTGAMEFRGVRDLPSFLGSGDLLVLNDSRVIPARISCKDATGKEIEFLILDPLVTGGRHRALAPGSGKFKEGDSFQGPGSTRFLFLGREDPGRVILEGHPAEGWAAYLDRWGRMPLPPYIRRTGMDLEGLDRERYQTRYAVARGSVAAPTAGLHFTAELLESVRAKADCAFLTLHVGEATFRSHEGVPPGTETYSVPVEAWDKARQAKRVVAVGTTVCRTLEHLATSYPPPSLPPKGERDCFCGETGIVISPGFEFRVVGALMTNFHLPESSPLALAAAFAGKEKLMRAYEAALGEGFRFASYGDSMLIL